MGSAREFVRARQNESPPRKPSEDEVEGFAESLGLSPEQRSEVLSRASETDYAQSLLWIIEPGLPNGVAALLEQGSVAVGEVGTRSANAHLNALEGGEYAVLFHSGLVEFVYRVARPLATVVMQGPGERSPEALDPPELARVIAEIFWWYQETGAAYGPRYEIERPQILFANALATYAEAFLLAHEFGHIYAAHQSSWREGLPDSSLASAEEHIADMAGLLTLLQAAPAGRGPLPDVRVIYAGAELALQIWHSMREVGMSFVDGVHPPADERISGLRVTLRQCCRSDADYEVAVSLAKDIEQLFRTVSKIISDPQEHEAAFRRAADELVAQLLSLLQRCTGGSVPDYLTFYLEAPDLIVRGYPEVVLDRVVRQVAHELKTTQDSQPIRDYSKAAEWGEDERDAIRQWWSQFQAFKLLMGLTQHLPEPAAGTYQAVLDREMGWVGDVAVPQKPRSP